MNFETLVGKLLEQYLFDQILKRKATIKNANILIVLMNLSNFSWSSKSRKSYKIIFDISQTLYRCILLVILFLGVKYQKLQNTLRYPRKSTCNEFFLPTLSFRDTLRNSSSKTFQKIKVNASVTISIFRTACNIFSNIQMAISVITGSLRENLPEKCNEYLILYYHPCRHRT